MQVETQASGKPILKWTDKLVTMTALDSLAELNRILDEWDVEIAAAAPGLATFDPIPKLKR